MTKRVENRKPDGLALGLSALIDVLPYIFVAAVIVGMATKLDIPQAPKAKHKEPERFKFLVRAFDFESM